MATYGFELYQEIFPDVNYQGSLKSPWLISSAGCTAGDALCVSSTAGRLCKATANCDDIVGVAAHDAAADEEIKVIDPRNIFRVSRKSGETAAYDLDLWDKCQFENARTIDISSTAGSTSQIRIVGILDTAASGDCLVTFIKTIY
jgi:hypothetical protein